MTPEEAKTKWCPMVRAKYYESEPGHNVLIGGNADIGHTRSPEFSRCIGPDCAMWRPWGDEKHPQDGECGLIRS